MAKDDYMPTLLSVLGILTLCLLVGSIYIAIVRSGSQLGQRATMPNIFVSYSGYEFMKSPTLLNEFEAQITSQKFIDEILTSKAEYAGVRSEVLTHWRPVIVQAGGARQIYNMDTRGRNVDLRLSWNYQKSLDAVRSDIYDKADKLMRELNEKYQQEMNSGDSVRAGTKPASGPQNW